MKKMRTHRENVHHLIILLFRIGGIQIRVALDHDRRSDIEFTRRLIMVAAAERQPAHRVECFPVIRFTGDGSFACDAQFLELASGCRYECCERTNSVRPKELFWDSESAKSRGDEKCEVLAHRSKRIWSI
jgi:hypothetical protein